jgi:hypothetical protein
MVAGEGPTSSGANRSEQETDAALAAIREGLRRLGRPPSTANDDLDPTLVAYEMELAEHRSTLERLHRSELTARDGTIRHQRTRIIELEAEVARLRTALQVLAGLAPPGSEGPSRGTEAREEAGGEQRGGLE